ncbi:hypothetical protein TEA_013703 [Camellia sinensis var. sinensis]|uniref:NmrA-like domain-containing protein n=1 Tax=Camellia sinensis var. sinensis TaxID=542762 RepID=A0A4S4DFK2_CAMSN|nr:hypothetical protein TEA_013703 [Camellia sinensis var. sinensis]
MQVVSRQLGHQSLKLSPAISSLNSIYQLTDRKLVILVADYGNDHPRYASTLTTKGVGHLVRKGTGGRSSVSGVVATVFGATGFLGCYVVQQLAKMGSQVLVPFRGSEDALRHLKLMGDLGQIAKEHGGIMRFIQVSCLGASSSSPSRMLRAKAAAEEAIMREIPEATILRPAVMIGTEDRILNRKLQLCPNLVDIFLKGLYCRIQPVYVVDVAAAIVTALNDDCTSMGKVFELGGPEVFTVHELAELMYDMIREWPRYVKVPFPIAKAIAMPREMFLNKVPFPLPTPTILNLDEMNALTQDTVVSPDALTFDDLGIMPHKLKGYPVEFLIQYRKGGPQYGSTVSKKVSPAAWPSKSSVL